MEVLLVSPCIRNLDTDFFLNNGNDMKEGKGGGGGRLLQTCLGSLLRPRYENVSEDQLDLPQSVL